MTQATQERLDEPALRRLLSELGGESRAFRFDVAPNPCVGAALLDGTRVVARGYHRVFGGPHAEVDALSRAAGARADTLVCTLEPCSSAGRTPPCTEAVLGSGVRRVVVGATDPDPRHRGRGLELLRSAGLEVVVIEGASPLAEVAPHFLRWNLPERLRRPRPWTIAKWAQTRTGQLRPPEDVGEGRWISGPESLAEVAVLRGRVDAILTGVGTVLADDPRLTVRPPGDRRRAPLRVVADSYLRTPPDARLFRAAGPDEAAGPVVVHALAGSDGGRHRALEAAGALVVGQRADEHDHVRLRSVLEWLWQEGVRRLLLECGPTLLARFLELGYADQIRVYTGSVNGGRGPNLGATLAALKLAERQDREAGQDSVLDAFLT